MRIVEFAGSHWGARWQERCGQRAFAARVTDHVQLATILSQMSEEAKRQQRFADDMLTALADQAVALCARSLPTPLAEGEVGLAHVERAKRIFITLIEQSPSVTMIATVIGIGPEHLSRLFRQHTGISARTWQLRERLRHAHRALREQPHLTLDAIALSVGYADAFTFSKAYKRRYGVSPRG